MSLENAPDDVAQAFNACTPKQRALAIALAKGMGREEAMLEAGYSKLQAHKLEPRVIDHPRVVKVANWLGGQAVAREVDKVERAIDRMADIALFDIKDTFGADGKMLPPNEWPDAARAAFAGFDGNGMPKFWSPREAADTLFKVKGRYAEADKPAKQFVVGVVIVPQKAEGGSQQVLEAMPVEMAPLAALDAPRTFQVKA